MNIEQFAFGHLETMGGWCSTKKALALHRIITQRQLKHCVEIGVFAGRSLCAIGIACEDIGGTVVGVDPYRYEAAADDENKANQDWWAKLNYEEVYQEAIRHINGVDIVRTTKIQRTTSRNFFDAHRMIGQPLDFLHIDGNHSEWNSTHDVVMWVPEVRSGGIICMDDMNWDSTGTAMRLLAKKADFLEFVSDDEKNCGFFVKR